MNLATAGPSSSNRSRVYNCRWGTCGASYYTYEDTINHELNHVRFDARRSEKEFEEEEAMGRRLEESSAQFIKEHQPALSPSNEMPSTNHESRGTTKRAMSVSSTTSQDFVECQLTQEPGDDEEGRNSRARSTASVQSSAKPNTPPVDVHVPTKLPSSTVPTAQENTSPVSPIYHPFELSNVQPHQPQQAWYSATAPRKSRRAMGEKDTGNRRQRDGRRLSKQSSKLRPLEMEVFVSDPSGVDLASQTQTHYTNP